MTSLQFILDLAEQCATKLRWTWAVFQVIAIKDKLNLRWRR